MAREEKQETREKVGGGTETRTTYTYDKDWSNSRIDSKQFAQETGHANPGSMRFQDWNKAAERVVVGAYSLSSGLVSQMSAYEPLKVAEQLKLPEMDGELAVVLGETLYLPNDTSGQKPDPNSPAVGDLRISWQVVRPAVVSVIAGQAKATLGPWQSSQAEGMGTRIERLRTGTYTAQDMVGQLEAENTLLTWLLRAGGFLIMAFGISIILKPIAVFASFIPIFGAVSRGGIAVFAMLVAMALSLTTIALAWLAYRPWLAGGLLAGAILSIVLVVSFVRRPAGQR
jgi:hypothetical protein